MGVQFITAKLPGYIKVSSDDLIEKYLVLTTSYDGYGCITVALLLVRIVLYQYARWMGNHGNPDKLWYIVTTKGRLEQAKRTRPRVFPTRYLQRVKALSLKVMGADPHGIFHQ